MSFEANIFRDIKFSRDNYNEFKSNTFEGGIIVYHRLYDLEMYINNTIEGSNLKDFVNSGNKISFIPQDSYHICDIDKYIYEKNKTFLESENVNFYSTDKLADGFTNLFWGSNVLNIVNENQLITADRKFNGSKHFLCLMGTIKPQRTWLAKFIKNQNILNKGIVSARWLGISPDGLTTEPHSQADGIKYRKELLDSFYNDCLFEIVTESKKSLVTEKTLKPLLYGVPFIVSFKTEDDTEKCWDSYLEGGDESFSTSASLQTIHWYKNMGIDINYFDIDYLNPNSIEEKIKELCSMSFKDILEKYKNTFEKAKQNQIIIKQKLNKFYETIG